jgi:hypothetical protein
MEFNKNQTDFPSEKHKEIWNTGIHILPLEITLTGGLRERLFQLSPDLPESCEQMQKYFLHLFGDIYENADIYKPADMFSRFRLFVDWGLMGEINDNGSSLVINRFEFDGFMAKLAKSVHYKNDKKSGVDMEYRLKLLERTGLFISKQEDKVIFTNDIYPKMFIALHEMAKITQKGKGRASDNPSFFSCDYRKLCKEYKYDKYEHAHIFLNDAQREIADGLVLFAMKNKMTRSVNASHNQGFIIEYNYDKKKLFELNCQGNEIQLEICIPFDRQNPDTLNLFLELIENDADSVSLKKFFLKNLSRCRLCNPKCGGYNITIFGKPGRLCRTWNGNISLGMGVLAEDVPPIEKIIGYIISYIKNK